MKNFPQFTPDDIDLNDDFVSFTLGGEYYTSNVEQKSIPIETSEIDPQLRSTQYLTAFQLASFIAEDINHAQILLTHEQVEAINDVLIDIELEHQEEIGRLERDEVA